MNKDGGLIHYRFLKWNGNGGEEEWPIYPHGFEESIRRGPFFYTEQKCPHMIVVLMLAGELLYKCQGAEYPVCPGDVLVIPVDADYEFATTASKYYHKLVLEFRGTLAAAVGAALRLNSPRRLSMAQPSLMETAMREFEKMLLDANPAARINALAQTYGFLCNLSMLNRASSGNRLSPAAQARFKLENETSGSLCMAELAAESGVCKSSLNRMFRAETSLSPLQYHIRVKMKEARRLLSNTNLTIKEIAFRVGYANQLYFSNAFRKNCGMPPREFRRKAERTTAP